MGEAPVVSDLIVITKQSGDKLKQRIIINLKTLRRFALLAQIPEGALAAGT